jgi:alpha-glucosidase
MDIRKIIYVFRAIGLLGIVRTIQYGFLRDRIDKTYSSRPSHSTNLVPGNKYSISPIEGGLRVMYEHASVEIAFLTQNLIKISWEPGKPPIPYTLVKSDWMAQKTEIKSTNSGHALICGKIEVCIDNVGGLLFRDIDGNLLRKDNPPIREADGWSLATILAAEEHIYGLGERASSLNLRPGSYCSWNTDAAGSYSHGTDPLYIGTPIYLSLSNSGGYLTYFENSYRSTFNLGDTFDVSFSGGMLRYYIIFGSLKELFSQLAELIGLPSMPPRWVLGYHQSRWGYRCEADIREVVKGFEEHDFPISAIHLDIDYMNKFRLFTIDPDRFPGMKQLSNELKEKGIKLVTSLNPAIKVDRKYEVYKDGLPKDIYCKLPNGDILSGVSWSGWSVFPDFTNPEARKWWKSQYQSLLKEGISGIWHDMNEPASFAGWGDKTFPLTTAHIMEGQGGDHREAHNLYGFLMTKAGYEALQEYSPDKRPWILSRAGWAGLQRFAWIWTGDVDTSWEALRQTIPTILGLGLSGHAFSGVDIGGFSGSPSGELYLRWFQLATFLPFFRTHSAMGTKPREPWLFGEPITDIVRKFLKLRNKLMPYLYTLVWQTNLTGYPAVRPLFWENLQEHNLWDIEDEFLLGDSLLIAPIMDEKAHYRQITLPSGLWYSFWDDHQYIGPTQLDYPATLATIPVFVKGGTLLPMDENEILCFHIYLGNDSRSSNQIYTDAGDGYGSWRLDTFQLTNILGSMDILWDYMGDYPFQYPSVKIQVHGKKLVKVGFDGNICSIQDNSIVIPKFQTVNLEYE